MSRPNKNGRPTPTSPPESITQLRVAGFKSIDQEQTIDVLPLTLLAGANSSGKSSMMQPLLLLKQTLEAPYDPGALLLNGPNVKFTSTDQLLFRSGKTKQAARIVVGIRIGTIRNLGIEFGRDTNGRLNIQHQTRESERGMAELSLDTSSKQLSELITRQLLELQPDEMQKGRPKGKVLRDRCFLKAEFHMVNSDGEIRPGWVYTPSNLFTQSIQNTIHLPGLRGNPERTYPVSAVGSSFPGTFEKYVASVIAHWASEGNEKVLIQLNDDVRSLGLTWKVEAKAIDDTQVELKVGRLPRPARGGTHDLVSIADVGLGVSQTLPVVVALLVAEPGQLVYLEQPEIHLHPRAQVAMARLLANAANRGVKVVVETHSSLLLLGVQSLVAEGQLSPEKVKLHWFQRSDTTGATTITSADLDPVGRALDWPQDFDDVTMDAQVRFLNAVEQRQVAR